MLWCQPENVTMSGWGDALRNDSNPYLTQTTWHAPDIYTYLNLNLHIRHSFQSACVRVCVFSKHTPESSGVISEPSSPLPSFSATKYRLLDHLREWFCSLNITISTFSCPTETTPPTPFHTPLNSTYASSFSHLDTINPLRRPPTTQSPWKICHLSAGWVLLFSGPGSGHTCGVRGTVGIVNLC